MEEKIEKEFTKENNITYVYVLTQDGKPLMPIKIGKAKHLIDSKKAVIVNHNPLQIKLCYEVENHVEDITLGIDTGAVHIGYSAISPTTKKEYIRGVLEQEHTESNSNPTKGRIDDRRMYRRMKRNKLWHREPRFDNRKRRYGLLPPSIERKYLSHKNLILKVKNLLPINNLIIEVGKFDIQKIKNPEIEGVGYQQGNLYEYNNMRSYLMAREQGRCQLCGETFEGRSAHIHHIIPRSKGGTNMESNLAILHKECHERLHKENLHNKLSKSKMYKEPTFMSSINKKFWEDFENMHVTYGNYTFVNRNKCCIVKSHSNDAFIIAGGDESFDRSIERNLAQIQRNNRALQRNNLKASRSKTGRSVRKGRKPYHKGDRIFINGEWRECMGMTNDRVILGYIVNKNGNKSAETVSVKKVEKAYTNNGIYFVYQK